MRLAQVFPYQPEGREFDVSGNGSSWLSLGPASLEIVVGAMLRMFGVAELRRDPAEGRELA
jgi:hypothetical protein